MARKYTKEELKERLQRSIYKVVAEEGIEGVTVRKVSKGCGLSDPYIYQCYKDLFDLMETSFFEVDGKAAGMIRKLIQNQKAELKTAEDLESMCWTLWSAYWEFLMSDPEQTIFYWRFYQSAHYTKKILEVRQQSFEVFVYGRDRQDVWGVRSDGSGGDRVQHHRQHRICSSQNASWIYGQDSSQGTNDLQNSICIIVPASAY